MLNNTRDIPVLYTSKNLCSGCGACAAVCPKNAISLDEDEYGFIYPRINESMCIKCNACKGVCGFQHAAEVEPTVGPFYAAASRDDCSRSASAGIFAALATSIITSGGCAFGAAYVRKNDGLHVCQIKVETLADLEVLKGSKYVQSNAMLSYSEVKQELQSGRVVLYSGTPCQIASLNRYLKKKYSNLLTIDLVCHGVPSEQMFKSMIDYEEQRLRIKIKDYCFRCKKEGWGPLIASLCPEREREGNRISPIYIRADESAYYDLFLRLKTLRDSCYICPFAGLNRPGDLTIGDFWGIDVNRPDLLEGPEAFDIRSGISCLLVNNEIGKHYLQDLNGNLKLSPVSFNDIAKGNEQLQHPALMAEDRELYLNAFKSGKWEAVERLWRKRERGIAFQTKKIIKRIVPLSIINKAKTFIR